MAESEKNELGTSYYIVAGLSFIPLVGIVFAIASIVLGANKIKNGGKTLIAMGCCGIAFTVVIYGSLFYKGFVERGGIFDGLRSKLAVATITGLVRDIEYYKVINGHYPDTLESLKDDIGNETFSSIYDPSSKALLNGSAIQTFYYQLSDDKSHYYLLGRGVDQTPFTSDDILPNIPESQRAKIGLLIK